MRIATWNVERLAHRKELDRILSECNKAGADILVLTETDKRLQPKYKNQISTPSLKGIRTPALYADTENRVSIFTNYACVQEYETYDEKTAVCAELVTENGNLLVYGTIIGISGNRRRDYNEDLIKQLDDIRRLSAAGHSLCIVGDYNCTFCDDYYYTKSGRNLLLECFNENHISILTEDKAECIDHIAISEQFLGGMKIVSIDEWNADKSLSDHKGVVVDIQ